MLKFIGIPFIMACVFGSYVALGGSMAAILGPAPAELTIIMGSAIGAFMIANSGHVIKATLSGIGGIFKKDKYDRQAYMELLSLLFVLFKVARTKGWLALESHVENPEESSIFQNYPTFLHDHRAVHFLCDYLRIISLGSDNPHELEALIDEEIETIKEESHHPGHALQTMADGIPALGIVAAVLGVIKTMGAISEPPEVLGKMIGGALVGTFLGVFLAYAYVGPMAAAMTEKADTELKYFICIKVCLLAFLQGAAPQVAVEFGRKILMHDVQPSFAEVEEATNNAEVPS